MTSLRRRLAEHRHRLVVQGATLRAELAGDMASLRQRVQTGARIVSLGLLVKPLLAMWWRRRRR